GENVGSQNTGAVRAFVRQGGLWSSAATIFGRLDQPEDVLGYAVALNENTIFAGSILGDYPNTNGAVCAFARGPGGTWDTAQVLTGNQLPDNNFFGWSLSLDGNQLAIGAYRGHRVYVYDRGSDGTWIEVAQLTDPTWGAYFGYDVALQGSILAVG